MDCLDIGEADLVRALIRWGKFQLQKDGDDPNDGQKLRGKILPGLHLIRFVAVNHVEFLQLCFEGLEEILSLEERYSIMKFITTEDWKQMPAHIAPAQLAPRRTPHFSFQPTNPLSHSGNGRSYIQFITFKLNKNAMLVGLAVKGSLSFLKNVRISLAVTKNLDSGRRPVLGLSQGEFSREGTEFFRATPNIDLLANTSYILTFSCASPPTCLFNHNYQKSITSDWLTPTIGTATNYVKLQQLVFKQSPWSLKSWLHTFLLRCLSEVKMQFTMTTRRD
jgi:hypothetical protein